MFRFFQQSVSAQFVMISSLPLTRVATEGNPQAMASSSALGIPSQREGSTNPQLCCRRSTTSLRSPRTQRCPGCLVRRRCAPVWIGAGLHPPGAVFSLKPTRHSSGACIMCPQACNRTSIPFAYCRRATQMISRAGFSGSGWRIGPRHRTSQHRPRWGCRKSVFSAETMRDEIGVATEKNQNLVRTHPNFVRSSKWKHPQIVIW